MKKKMKHSLVAAEVIAADNWSIVEALYENSQLLEQFFSFLTVNPPLSPPLLSACTKAAGALSPAWYAICVLQPRSGGGAHWCGAGAGEGSSKITIFCVASCCS